MYYVICDDGWVFGPYSDVSQAHQAAEDMAKDTPKKVFVVSQALGSYQQETRTVFREAGR